MTRHTFTRTAALFLITASLTATANAQSAFYTFTSGTFGDGFNWPASPTGILDSDTFITPDENINIENFTGNNTFFDSQYQAAGNSSAITADAWWGNPIDGIFSEVGVSFYNSFNGTATTINFDFAWAIAGQDADTIVDIQFDDGQGGFAFESYPLFDVFNAGGVFGGFNGSSGQVSVDVQDLFDIDTGAPLQGIESMMIDLNSIATLGGTGEFAIDNLQIDGGTGGGTGNTLFPSVNSGAFDVSGSSISSNVLRGPGTASMGLEVTNNSGVATTFSTVFVPGGGLTDAGQVSGQAIVDGQSIFNSGLVSLDSSLPTGTYSSDIQVINDGDPLDPDDTVTLSIDIYDAPSLSGNFPGVNVAAAQTVDLANAAAATNGFRASVKVTGTQTTGPFSVQGYDANTPVKPGNTLQGTASFNRYGLLSGNHAGTFTASLAMTAFVGTNNDIEVFLVGAQPVPDQQWALNFNLINTNSDSVNRNFNDPLGPSVIGVNNATTAMTLLDGQSAATQNLFMTFTTDPEAPGTTADLVGTSVDLTFSSGNVDTYVIQFTYDDANIPPGTLESQLEVLFYDTIAGAWDAAVVGNTSGGSAFFNGSYADYLAAVGGGVLDPTDLGVFGVDTVNNNAWAVIDFDGVFGVGVLATAIAGDLDGDGFVGIADLNIVLGSWNQNVPPANPLADPSGDGFVGIEDLNTVLGNWNAGTPPGESSNIPEPGTLLVLGLMGAGLLKRG